MMSGRFTVIHRMNLRPRIDRLRLLIVPTLVLGLAGGCATYDPQPIEPGMVAQRQAAAQFEADVVRAKIQQLAPDYQWDGRTFDALSLFAAALVTSPEAAQARTALAAGEANARASRVAPGPSFTLTTEYAFNPTEDSHWTLGVGGDALLDVGGRRRGRLDAADIALERARLDYVQSLWSIRMAVHRALLAHRFARDEAALAAELAALRRQQFDTVLRRLQAGEIPRADVERVRGDLAQSLTRSADATAVRDRTLLDLAAVIGVAPAALNGMTILPGPDISSLPAEPSSQAVGDALAARGEILTAVVDYDLAESGYRTAVAAQFPEMRVGAGYTWERGLSKLPIPVTLSLPSWDLNAAAIRAASAARDDAGARLESAVAAVSVSIRDAQTDYTAARAVATLTADELLPAAVRLAGQAERELAAGSIDRSDWAAAQAGLASARLDRLAAERRAGEAFLVLEDTLRQPLAGPEMLIGSLQPPMEDAP